MVTLQALVLDFLSTSQYRTSGKTLNISVPGFAFCLAVFSGENRARKLYFHHKIIAKTK